MRIGVGQRSETIVVFLTSRIPKSQLDVLAVNLDVGDVVLEDGGNVDLAKERNRQQTASCIKAIEPQGSNLVCHRVRAPAMRRPRRVACRRGCGAAP